MKKRSDSRQSPPAPRKKRGFPALWDCYRQAVGCAPEGGVQCGDASAASRTEVWAWAAAALALVVIGFTCLEIKDPWFFTHDDNYNSLGPGGICRCRNVFSGVLPVWNQFQGAGRPTIGAGATVFYLPSYVNYGISRFLLGNEFYFVEVTICFNLLFAAAAGFWAGRKWGLSPALACALGLSYSFSGFLLITSRAWLNLSSTAPWLPLIFGCCAPSMLRRASWQWALGAGAVMGFAFYSGFTQLWVYAILFESMLIAALFLSGAISFRNMSWNIPAVFVAVAIALPIIGIQMDFGKDVVRNFTANEYDMRGVSWKALLAALLPPPGISMTHPTFCPYDSLPEGYKDSHAFGVYYYSGAVFSWACVLLLASLVLVRWRRHVVARNIPLLLAVLALLLCLGSNSPVPFNKWMSSLPWFEKFRQPWRYYIFFVFFSSLAGALFFERLSRCLRHARLVQWGVAAAVIVLLAAMLPFPIPTWMLRPSSVYPPLSPGIQEAVKGHDARFPQRAVSWARQSEFTPWFQSKDYPDALIASMPSLYGVLSLNRYNTLTWANRISRPVYERFNNDPINAWRAYGVRWIICHPKVRPVNPNLFKTWTSPPVKVGNVSLLERPSPAPLAFVKEREKEPLPISLSAKGAKVQFPSATTADEQVVVNVLGWPRFRAYADGKPVPWTPDDWGRVLVSVPANTQKLEVLYEPAWRKGTVGGILLAAVALCLSAAFAWFDRRFPPQALPAEAPWKTRLASVWPVGRKVPVPGPSGELSSDLKEDAAAQPELGKIGEAAACRQQPAIPKKRNKKK